MIKIDESKCIKCELCVMSCATNAIKPKEYTVRQHRCMGCSHCVAVCPKDAVTQDDKIGEFIEPHNITPGNFENLIYTRKSIRNYSKKGIDNETLARFLDLMKYAPTGTNSQKTFVTVLKDRDFISGFAVDTIEFFKKLTKLAFNPVTYIFVRLIMGKDKCKKMFSYKKALQRTPKGKDILTFNAPLVVVFHASPESTTPDMDCNIQASYSSLHAVTLGLGTCFNGFITRGLNANKKLKKQIGIPKKNKVYSTLVVGYPELDYKKRVIREDLKVNII